jgi:hypothetical protein
MVSYHSNNDRFFVGLSVDRIKGTLIDMYARLGDVHKARSMFTAVEPDVVMYALLIKAYSKSGNAQQLQW